MQHFFSGFFQFGYVTRDLDSAIASYRARYGDMAFLINDPAPTDGVASPTKRLGLGFIDDVMIEIIQPDTTQKTIYDDVLPATVGPVHLHHFGFLIDDHDAMLERLDALGYAVPFQGKIEGFLDFSYADTRADLGHYSEFIRLDAAGRAFFDSVPRLTTR